MRIEKSAEKNNDIGTTEKMYMKNSVNLTLDLVIKSAFHVFLSHLSENEIGYFIRIFRGKKGNNTTAYNATVMMLMVTKYCTNVVHHRKLSRAHTLLHDICS